MDKTNSGTKNYLKCILSIIFFFNIIYVVSMFCYTRRNNFETG